MRLSIQFFVIIVFFLIISIGYGQLDYKNPVKATDAEKRLCGFEQRQKLLENSLFKNVPFRSVGPSVMSGRAVDIDANPENPAEFYVAYASGGLWKTENNGQSFVPLFDKQPVMTIGDIGVDWKHDQIIWVGTGENNSSRSSYSGTGIYKSIDQGKTWQHMGLSESHHTGRIIIHPDDPNTVWVAALGHLYSSNDERGVFKTTDGGQTWRKVLFVNKNTGAIDLVPDPSNPDVLYASFWERTRRTWNIVESGLNSGVYKSMDSGENWRLLSTGDSGFPTGNSVGRIGLAVAPTNPDIVYAFLDNQAHREKEKHMVTKDLLRAISREDFIKLDENDLNDFLDRHNFPKQFFADTLFQLVQEETIKPVTLVEYLEDANSLLFDTPVIGGEVYRSGDGGKTWAKTHEDYLDNLVYTFGYYFGEVRVSPDNPGHIYVLGVPIIKSEDGGKTFFSVNRKNVHVDHHALWVDPNTPGRLIDGNDGGINITYDDGKNWFKANSPPVGQFYTVAVDMAKPYQVYGGLQDNGVWNGPGAYKANAGWRQSGHYPYKSIMGGDGMQIAIDTRTNNTVFTGYQFGNYYRIDKISEKSKYITPRHDLGERPLRFNWQTPIHLSIHNQDILYMGSYKLHRSMNQGDDWQVISDDLTQGGKKGDVPYGTLTTIHESPLKFGLIYTGSDDGLIHVSADGGNTWKRITKGLPENFWISRVQASAHQEDVVYASLNGYRWDNFESLVYKSDNYGKTWQRIGKNLPAEPVNVIKEDPDNENILYVGTDHSLYISIDGGKSFMAIGAGLPDAPVHDLVVHPRENDLVIGTHGRSIYIAGVKPIQTLTSEIMKKALYLYPIEKLKYSAYWGGRQYDWNFREAPQVSLVYWSQQSGKGKVSLYALDSLMIKSVDVEYDKGLNYLDLDLDIDEQELKKYLEILASENYKADKVKAADNGDFYLTPGEYKVMIESGNQSVKGEFEITASKKKERKKQKKTP